MHIEDQSIIDARRAYDDLRYRAMTYATIPAILIALGLFVTFRSLMLALDGRAWEWWVPAFGILGGYVVWRVARGALLPPMMLLDLAGAHDRMAEETRAALLRRGLDIAPGWRDRDVTRGRLTAVDGDGRRTKVHVACANCRLGVRGHFGDVRRGGDALDMV